MGATILYVVDAFTNRPFAGNPAAVCLTQEPCDETWMQNVAREMNLAETAFVYPLDTGGYSLRWFTPTLEVDLCGHATLASAYVLWETGVLAHDAEASFLTRSGWLTARYSRATAEGFCIELDFPAEVVEPCSAIPAALRESIVGEWLFVGKNRMDYLIEIDDEDILMKLAPNLDKLQQVEARGLIVTCKSKMEDRDFVSRFFAPSAGVPEDPVTGSAHCALGPYWASKLHKQELIGYQASSRGGYVQVVMQGARVLLRGQAVLMSRIELYR